MSSISPQVCVRVEWLWAPLLMSLCSGDGAPSPERGGMEKGVELNSFPSHEFFSASFHANFHFACPKAPSLPPPFTPFLPYSASVACATGGETFSSEARSVCREQTRESCAQLPLEQESEPFANSGSRFPSAAAVRPIIPYPIGRRATLPSFLAASFGRDHPLSDMGVA